MSQLGVSPLLTRRQTLAAARHTFRLAKQAAVKGNMRLGVSRAITAVIQASIAAAHSTSEATRRQADLVIQDARTLIMGIVVEEARIRKVG